MGEVALQENVSEELPVEPRNIRRKVGATLEQEYSSFPRYSRVEIGKRRGVVEVET